jgi:two-component system, OmpR family, alkaline phosphatase synthesis response regulator PhoP
MSKVLIVEDEESLVKLIKGYLEREGFQVMAATDGQAGLDLARQEGPDVAILDVMLPGLDGFEVCRRLRQFSNAYVIMLTARAEEVDKLVGLAVGADDYVTKPFSPRELVARIRAMLRRPRGGPVADEISVVLRFGDLAIDQGRHEVLRGDRLVNLTPLEYRLLVTLATNAGFVFTRERLFQRVWGYDSLGDDHALDVHVGSLRRKIEDDPAKPRWVRTVRGVGYRFEGSQ